MRLLFFSFLFCCAYTDVTFGQTNECYDELLQKGKEQFNAGDYDKAIVKWKGALECPDLTGAQIKSLNDWIAKAKPLPVTMTPSVSNKITPQSYEPEMVSVQGGSFQMGSNDGNSDEKPVHSVTLSSFYIGKYEVTQKQWRAVMDTNPSSFENCDDCPVERVSWEDVQEYLKKLNANTGHKYRLPTEAEWEFAARGGTQSKGYTYSGSNNIGDVAWYDGNSGNIFKKNQKTHPIGKKQSNELGLFDMTGNVWEWCNDWKDTYPSGSQTNPTGAATGSTRVVRGGTWFSSGDNCRVANRFNDDPSSRFYLVGFRVARYD